MLTATLIRNDLPALRKAVEQVVANAPKKAAKILKEQILKRTAEGKDVNGAEFKDYTPAYKKRKAKLGYATSPVNLRQKGSMLDSFDFYSEIQLGNSKGAALAVSAEENPKAVGNQRYRDFAGVGIEDFSLVESEIVTDLNAI